MIKCARGIIILKDHLLLIKRIKNNHLYYVFPGGHCLENEEDKMTCIREVKEETNLDVLPFKKIKTIKESNNFKTVYYLCKLNLKYSLYKELPVLKLIGDEKYKNNKKNYYKPIWIQLTQVRNILIYPKEVIEYILNNFKQ